MRANLSFGLVLLILLSSSVATGAVSFMLAPPRIEMTVRPRSVQQVPLTVLTDPGEEMAYFRFYVVDFTVSKTGQVEYGEPGSSKRSAASWIELEEREFEMESSARKDIDMTITVPSAASGGYYAAVILEALPVDAMRAGKRLLRTLRMVTLVELTVRGQGEGEGAC